MTSVAIVGAGVTGLACARALVDGGAQVTVFDKGRSAGGRLATRREDAHVFDLGAQYFTVRDERFARVVAASGACAVWPGRLAALDVTGQLQSVEPLERWVGVPTMSALGRHLAAGLDVRCGHRVERIERVGGGFALRGTIAPAGETLPPPPADAASAQDLGRFDRVVITVPAPQATPLLAELGPRLAAEAGAIAFEPCFAVGLVADALRELPFDGVFVGRGAASPSSILTWAARDSSKPGRPAGERWVLHAAGAWSWEHAHDGDVTELMIAELARLFGLAALQPELTVMRRWALARATAPLAAGALFDEGIALGGDWASGGRVEGAFVSGLALAERVLRG